MLWVAVLPVSLLHLWVLFYRGVNPLSSISVFIAREKSIVGDYDPMMKGSTEKMRDMGVHA